MRQKLDKHGLKLNRVRQTVAFVNKAKLNYPEDTCKLYYDISLNYVLPIDRNSHPSFYEQKGNIFLCEKVFKGEVTVQDIYDIVDEYKYKLDEYRKRKSLGPRQHTIVATNEEWEYILKELEVYRQSH